MFVPLIDRSGQLNRAIIDDDLPGIRCPVKDYMSHRGVDLE
jgi:hypothetical protein